MEKQTETGQNQEESKKELHLLSKILLLPALAAVLLGGPLAFISITLSEGPLDNRGQISSDPSANVPLEIDRTITETQKQEFYRTFNMRFNGNLSGPTALPLMLSTIIVLLISLFAAVPLFSSTKPANTLRYLPLLTIPLAAAGIYTYIDYSELIHFYLNGSHAMVYSCLRYTTVHYVIFGLLILPPAALFMMELKLSQAALSILVFSLIFWFGSGFLTDTVSLFAKSNITWSKETGITQSVKLAGYPLIEKKWKPEQISALKFITNNDHFHKYIFSARNRLYLMDSHQNKHCLGFADRQTNADRHNQICLKLSDYWKTAASALNVPYTEETEK